MGDLTRRAFIGRTLLTGATIASGGLSTISTTPTPSKVAISQKGIRWTNLNVLSPKAKAYRTFLRGIVGGAEMYQKHRPTGRLKTSVKSILTKHSEYNQKTGNIERVKTSYARNAFETSISKPDQTGPFKVAIFKGKNVTNAGTSNLAISMKTNTREMKQGFMDPKNTSAGKETRSLAKRITRGARLSHADELKAYRKANPDRMFKKMSARKHAENVKTKSTRGGGGGGGKTALPGLETARNPTGMSLLNRFTL